MIEVIDKRDGLVKAILQDDDDTLKDLKKSGFYTLKPHNYTENSERNKL